VRSLTVEDDGVGVVGNCEHGVWVVVGLYQGVRVSDGDGDRPREEIIRILHRLFLGSGVHRPRLSIDSSPRSMRASLERDERDRSCMYRVIGRPD
jgi:hypothetical protein